MQMSLYSKLDLDEYIKKFQSYFARQKQIAIEGDSKMHFEMIAQLQKYNLNQIQDIQNLDTAILHLSKQGVLHVSEIFEFVKIISYMKYLKTQKFEDKLALWIDKIIIPQSIDEIVEYFDEKGELKSSIDVRFEQIENLLLHVKENINVKLKQLFSTKKLEPYLVDRQVHYLNNQEALLLRGGFNHALKGVIIGRSSGGFFYIVPDSLNALKKEQSDLFDKKQTLIIEYCKKISNEFYKKILFLKFINKEFDRFDHYNARANFAKDNDFEFILPNQSNIIKIKEFKHPALNDPKSISIDFDKSVLMVTGVNAGGKTMLLKSILSVSLLAKYLLPMKINATASKIGSFKQIQAIIEDPQNAHDNISTFAGRMLHFSQLFTKKQILVGIDEIELGTDADEAASLFYVMIKKLISLGVKIVVTTHHKRLASLLATDENVQLIAALYDEKMQKPTYEFLSGTIGKSYAFETALRYGIPALIVHEAKKVYGEDKENLNELIQKNIDLELTMREKLKDAKERMDKVQSMKEKLLHEKQMQNLNYKNLYDKLSLEFEYAINEAKKAAKSKDLKQIHQGLNIAQNAKKLLKPNFQTNEIKVLKVGDRVKYANTKGEIISIKKDQAIVLCNGISVKLPLTKLQKTSSTLLKTPSKVHIQKPTSAHVKLDLHGLRADEAIDRLDKFLSDALLSGFDEVLVYHGIGTGKLSFAVKEFLKAHPKVLNFIDAPPSMGGFGAKIVSL